MLTLTKIDRRPQRQEVLPGVWITIRRATSIDVMQAEAEASHIVADWLKAPHGLTQFGLDESGGVAEGEEFEEAFETQMDRVFGLTRFVVNALLFEALVTEWEGVGAEDGGPVPLDRLHIGMFLSDDARMRAFERAAWATQAHVSAEGNGSAASPNGSVGAAETTAEVAPN